MLILMAIKQKTFPVQGGATEMTVSPDGKEIAFVYRGELFAASAEGGIVKRLTNTPYQERMIRFSTDGRSILYSVRMSNHGTFIK